MMKRWILALFFLMTLLGLGTAAADNADFEIENGVLTHYYGDGGEKSHADILQVVHALVDYPSEERGSEVEGTGEVAFRHTGGGILRGSVHLVGSLGEGGSHVGDEIETDGQGDETDDEGLHHVTFREGQHHGEEVEHASQ